MSHLAAALDRTPVDVRPPEAAPSRRSADRHRAAHTRGFWSVAVAFTVLMAFGTAPTPLWPLYAERDGFGATTVTVAFAVLVLGAVAGFVGLGHLSDRLGRRRIVVPALAVAAVAALVLVEWTTLEGLLVGRFLAGAGIGLMASTATAYLHDLHHRRHPDRPDAALPGVVASLANLGGLALGPLVAGVIAQWVGHPLTVVQSGFALTSVLCLVTVWVTPETVERTGDAGDQPPRFGLRPGTGTVFGAAAALAVFSFALFGLISSLGAVILVSRLGITSHLVAGVAAFLMFGASALAQLLLGRLAPRPMSLLGATLLPVGLLLVTGSLYRPALWLFLLAVTVAGAGAGLLFKCGVVRATEVAREKSRAGVLAMFFVAGYLGMGLPAVLFSVASRHVGLGPAMVGFAAVLSVGAVSAVVVGNNAARSMGR
ncbi:MFS transporter [Streptomyces violaceorubidus]|uniref:MFS transporter n=1 Tax=Streptomyces violaceorubidus TaxID=284042 RepID=A0ABV1T247_9ACTN